MSEVPPARPTSWEQIAYRQADELAKLRRLLQDQEKRCGFGYLAVLGEPFGSVQDTQREETAP